MAAFLIQSVPRLALVVPVAKYAFRLGSEAALFLLMLAAVGLFLLVTIGFLA